MLTQIICGNRSSNGFLYDVLEMRCMKHLFQKRWVARQLATYIASPEGELYFCKYSYLSVDDIWVSFSYANVRVVLTPTIATFMTKAAAIVAAERSRFGGLPRPSGWNERQWRLDSPHSRRARSAWK